MLRLHDTASGAVGELVPRDEGRISLYVCGPTVYDIAHVGHGRFVLVYDVLRRYLEFRGLSVHHVSNVTDIDDKIIDRANRENRPWQDVAEEFESRWWSALDALGVARPQETPHATAFVEKMVELVSSLIDVGAAYESPDGVYLEVERVPGYGLLAHQSLQSLRPGARIDVSEDKRSPYDFALWKRAKPGEPSWPSPFGDGRPGWHTECVVMSLELLGDGFDLHGGGQDLVFPHHENERAQAVALGRAFARRWVHNGLVTVGGEKMAKSVGNYETLEHLLASTDPRAYRLLVLRAHYRSQLEVNEDTLSDASNALGRLDAFSRRLDEAPPGRAESPAVIEHFVAAMDDDLDSPRALAGLFEVIRRSNAEMDVGEVVNAAEDGRTALRLFEALGVSTGVGKPKVDAGVADLVSRRDAARIARDFDQADKLRAEIESRGWHVEDTATGTRIYR